MKICHECGVSTKRGAHRCEPCHRVYFPIMEGAIYAVNTAVRYGQLPKLSEVEIACVDCGVRATQYEHRDYMKPLDVEPVCRKCNKKRGPAARLPISLFNRGGLMKTVTIPAPIPPERDPGVIDVSPETLADRQQVAQIRDYMAKRDRNATPRTTDPEAA